MATNPDAMGQRSETVRRGNLSAILRDLHDHGPESRSELVARTGLTRSAIRGLIGELAAGGLVTEQRAVSLGGPGRPSPLVRPNPNGAVVIALDIAVDSLAAAVVGLGGVILERIRVDRSRGRQSVEEVTADVADLAAEVRRRLPPGQVVVGIGVAVVGIVRRSDGFVSMAPNLGWRDVPLGEHLAAALATSAPIAIANEADLGALAEHRRGVARGYDDVLFVSGEVGVGGGLIIGGRPLTGAAGYGGEVGHLPVNPLGIECRCGSIGCWETEAGEAALLRRADRPGAGGRAAVDAFLEEAESGSPMALAALEEQGRWVGVGLGGLINIFNPRLIVLGGLFAKAHRFIAAAVERELDRSALPGPRDLVRIIPARLGIDGPLLGAAELVFEPLLADPAAWLRPREAGTAVAGAR